MAAIIREAYRDGVPAVAKRHKVGGQMLHHWTKRFARRRRWRRFSRAFLPQAARVAPGGRQLLARRILRGQIASATQAVLIGSRSRLF